MRIKSGLRHFGLSNGVCSKIEGDKLLLKHLTRHDITHPATQGQQGDHEGEDDVAHRLNDTDAPR